jgi:hypothetical protein
MNNKYSSILYCINYVFLLSVSAVSFSVKGKVFPVLFLSEHHAIKAYWGDEV